MTAFNRTRDTELQEWATLRTRLDADPEGAKLLERFQGDPTGTRQELEDWLSAKWKEAPARIANLISGGHVEKLVNIASADRVILNLTANPQALHQLPPDIADFTGRSSEVEQIIESLRAQQPANVTPVIGISGMPGVGKSALAVHVCYRLLASFPDAQLYINLRGDSSGTMVKSSDALATLIRSLGVSESGIAGDLDDRSSQFRGLLRNKRALILIDNVRAEEQVRPLLPSASGCAVVVTSRTPLSALEGAKQITLDVLNPADGLELLTRVAGADRIAEDPESSKRLASLAGGLPLAVRILGGTLLRYRHRTIASQVSVLEDHRSRLAKLKLGDLEVRSSFDASYLQLSASEKKLFRYAGALPGPTLSLETISWMSGETETDTQETLDNLILAQLVELVRASRFRLHDLMRLFAREKFQQEETAEERKRLWVRLAEGYRPLVLTAGLYISSKENPQSAGDEVVERRQMSLGGMLWFDLERANLAALTGEMHASGEHEMLLQLADPFLHYLWLRGRASEGLVLAELCVEVARTMDKPRWQAAFLNSIGGFFSSQFNWIKAKQSFEEALAIARAEHYREDELGILINVAQAQAGLHEMDDALRNSLSAIEGYRNEFPGNRGDYGRALHTHANILSELSRFLEALPLYNQTLELAKEIKDIHLQSSMYLSLGTVLRNLGRLDEALDAYSSAARMFEVMEDRNATAQTLSNLANVYNSQGQFSEAVAACLQALEIYREFKDRVGEANALNNLGISCTDLGNWAEAEKSLLASLEIRKALNDPTGVADVLSNLGNLEARRARWEPAIAKYTEARKVYEKLGTTYEIAKMQLNIGNAELQSSKFDRAIHNTSAALEEFQLRGDDHSAAKAVLNLGLAYFHMKMPEQALANYKQALDLFSRIGDRQGFGSTAHNIGKLFAAAYQWETAIAWFEKDLAICKAMKDKPGALTTLWEIALCHLALEDLQAAETTMLNYLELTRELFEPLLEGRALANLANIAYLQGDIEKAVQLGNAGLRILSELNHPDAFVVTDFLQKLQTT